MSTIINPDCRDRKHASCSGTGWDDSRDKTVLCPCICHTKDTN